ncbi:MAG: patatin-like phospholipase family protein [Bacteroidetes bacterium]|nr:patatin-like phospholipase family protein [Bacteroidota bacterium]
MTQQSFLENRTDLLKTLFNKVTGYLLRKVYPHIHDVFAVLRFVWFHMLMLGVGYFTLTFTDQARDMLYVLAEALESGVRKILLGENLFLAASFFLGILWWSFVMWFTTRMVLKSGNIRLLRYNVYVVNGKPVRKASPYIRFFIRMFPRVAGSLPFLFVMMGVWQLNRDPGFTVVLFGCLTLLAIIGFSLRTKIQDWFATRRLVIRLIGKQAAEKLKTDPHRFDTQHRSLKSGGRGIAVIALLLALFLFVWLSVDKTAALAQGIGPHGLILSALGVWTVFGSMLVVFSNQWRIPGFLLLLIYMVGISHCNNNHEVRTVVTRKRVNARPQLTAHIANWMNTRVQEYNARGDSAEIPIIIVAAQGGGIRAMNWTARVMHRLSNHPQLPGFYRQVFAMSGVSGGSVGLAVHTAFMHDGGCTDTTLGTVVSADYLSPVTAGLLYPDMLQKFLFWEQKTFDRARRLEDAWAEEYAAVMHAKENTLNEDFLSLWEGNTSNLPAIFLNSVLAENGQKAIISSIVLDSVYFPDAIDVIGAMQKDFPLKSAALCSARFPFVTPGGLVKFSDNSGGHLIDGGYLENTGLVTALSIISAINDYINGMTSIANDPLSPQAKKRFKPVLLFIQNADFANKQPEPLTTMHELTVPPSGFISAWDRAGVALDKQMQLLPQKLTPKVTYLKFELDRNIAEIPLSWYISEVADQQIKEQALWLENSKLPANKNGFQSLLELFKGRKK